MRPITKSLVLGILATFVNFFTYFTYRLIFFEAVTIWEGIGFTIYESIFHFIIIGGVSYFFFKKAGKHG